MKKPNSVYRTIGPKTRMGVAFRAAHYTEVKSLRSAFRGVEWVLAGTFSGATLCKQWVGKLMSAMNKMHIPYRGRKLSGLFAMMARTSVRQTPSPRPEIN